MNIFIMHFVSGQAFFSGVGLMMVAIVMSLGRGGAVHRTSFRLIFILGVIFAALSSTPLPLPLLAALYLLPLSVMVLSYFENAPERTLKYFRVAALCVCLVSTGLESVRRSIPGVPALGCSKVYVLADSVSAGIGFRGERIWPGIVEEKTGVKVVNLSRGGGTVKSTQAQAAMIKDSNVLVFLEIGGNDMLGRTSLKEFREDLDKLLGIVEGKGRVIVMMEPPWAPFHERFCAALREIAKRHGAILIPRKVFAWVLSGGESTVDGIHLSNRGQEKMAEVFLEICGPALARQAAK